MKRKLTSFLLYVLLSVAGVFAQGTDNFEFESYGSGVKLTGYDGDESHVEIPAKLGGKNVLRIGGGAFEGRETMTSVTIPNTVISLGDGAFYLCGLTAVNIPASVSSIEEDVFGECFNLTAINVDVNNSNYASVDGVLFNKAKTHFYCYPAGKTTENYSIPTSVTKIFDDSFFGIQLLKTVLIPKSVTEMAVWEAGEVACNFANCPSLTAINVDVNNKYFVSVDGVLFNKSKTKLLAYPSGRGESEYTIPSTVKTIADESFTAEGMLEVLNVPGSVTVIEAYAMDLCTSLRKIIFAGRPPTLQPYVEDGEEYGGDFFPNVWTNDTVICAYLGLGWDNLDTFGDLPVVIIAQLDYLVIEGDDEIIANSQSEYFAVAEYTDGVNQEVNPAWSITSGGLYATVDANGIVTAKSVTAQQSITLTASYTEGGVSRSNSKNISILPVILTALYINGTDAVTSGEQAAYTATATFSDWGEKNVIPTWRILNESGYASVNANGNLTATDELYQQQYVTLNASYTDNGVTKTTDKQITIKAKQPKLTGMELTTETKTVLAGNSAQLNASVSYNVGENKNVNPTWSVIKGEQIANIVNNTVTVASNIDKPDIITLQASYSENGITVSKSIDLAVMPIVYPENTFEYTYVFNPGWQLISIVLNLTDESKQNLMQNFTIFIFDSEANCYLTPQELKAGMSCWLFAHAKMDFIVQGTPVGRKLP